MSDRRNLHKTVAALVSFIDKNPTDRRKGRGPGHDVSNEPRVTKGNPEGGEWTTGESSTSPSDRETGSKCPDGYDIVPMLTTGYTSGPESTGKRPGDPFYGRTAGKTKAGPGTIAASPHHDFGTRMYVPGYGWGTVQDRGGKVKGNHIDLWFEKVEDAIKWGKRHVNVVVCRK